MRIYTYNAKAPITRQALSKKKNYRGKGMPWTIESKAAPLVLLISICQIAKAGFEPATSRV